MIEKELKKFWKKYINIKIYRVIPEEYLYSIKKHGLNPRKDPLKEKYNEIKKLFKIIKKFEEKGIVYMENWRDGPRKGSEIIKINKKSINNKYLDFVQDYEQALKFKNKWKGGALVNTIFNFINFLKKQKLYDSEKELIKKLSLWVDKKRAYKNIIIYVMGSSKFFEKSKFLLLPIKGKKEMVKSPYGSYRHFKKTMKDKYKEYLKKEELSYLRVVDKIPKEEILVLK